MQAILKGFNIYFTKYFYKNLNNQTKRVTDIVESGFTRL